MARHSSLIEAFAKSGKLDLNSTDPVDLDAIAYLNDRWGDGRVMSSSLPFNPICGGKGTVKWCPSLDDYDTWFAQPNRL